MTDYERAAVEDLKNWIRAKRPRLDHLTIEQYTEIINEQQQQPKNTLQYVTSLSNEN